MSRQTTCANQRIRRQGKSRIDVAWRRFIQRASDTSTSKRFFPTCVGRPHLRAQTLLACALRSHPPRDFPVRGKCAWAGTTYARLCSIKHCGLPARCSRRMRRAQLPGSFVTGPIGIFRDDCRGLFTVTGFAARRYPVRRPRRPAAIPRGAGRHILATSGPGPSLEMLDRQ